MANCNRQPSGDEKINRICKNVLCVQQQPEACASDVGDGSRVTSKNNVRRRQSKRVNIYRTSRYEAVRDDKQVSTIFSLNVDEAARWNTGSINAHYIDLKQSIKRNVTARNTAVSRLHGSDKMLTHRRCGCTSSSSSSSSS